MHLCTHLFLTDVLPHPYLNVHIFKVKLVILHCKTNILKYSVQSTWKFSHIFELKVVKQIEIFNFLSLILPKRKDSRLYICSSFFAHFVVLKINLQSRNWQNYKAGWQHQGRGGGNIWQLEHKFQKGIGGRRGICSTFGTTEVSIVNCDRIWKT